MTLFTDARRFWTPTRLGLSLLTLALVMGISVTSCTNPAEVATNGGNGNAANPGQPPANNRPASNNPNNPPPATPLPEALLKTELKSLDGRSFKLADYEGKVLLVNLWATWCGPCRVEVPELVRITDEYKARGLEVIGLTSEDPVADEEKVKNFVKQYNINYKIGWSDQQFALDLMQGNIRNSIPQSFLIARDRKVLKRFIGYNPVETPPKLKQALEEALAK